MEAQPAWMNLLSVFVLVTASYSLRSKLALIVVTEIKNELSCMESPLLVSFLHVRGTGERKVHGWYFLCDFLPVVFQWLCGECKVLVSGHSLLWIVIMCFAYSWFSLKDGLSFLQLQPIISRAFISCCVLLFEILYTLWYTQFLTNGSKFMHLGATGV